MERARKVTFSWELSLKKDPSCIAHNTSCVTSLKVKPLLTITPNLRTSDGGSSLACQQHSSLLLKHSGYQSKEIVYSLSTPNWCHPSSAAQPSKHRGPLDQDLREPAPGRCRLVGPQPVLLGQAGLTLHFELLAFPERPRGVMLSGTQTGLNKLKASFALSLSHCHFLQG